MNGMFSAPGLSSLSSGTPLETDEDRRKRLAAIAQQQSRLGASSNYNTSAVSSALMAYGGAGYSSK